MRNGTIQNFHVSHTRYSRAASKSKNSESKLNGPSILSITTVPLVARWIQYLPLHNRIISFNEDYFSSLSGYISDQFIHDGNPDATRSDGRPRIFSGSSDSLISSSSNWILPTNRLASINMNTGPSSSGQPGYQHFVARSLTLAMTHWQCITATRPLSYNEPTPTHGTPTRHKPQNFTCFRVPYSNEF